MISFWMVRAFETGQFHDHDNALWKHGTCTKKQPTATGPKEFAALPGLQRMAKTGELIARQTFVQPNHRLHQTLSCTMRELRLMLSQECVCLLLTLLLLDERHFFMFGPSRISQDA
ncbi:hypothetical protein [Yoonia sediminilitoris]|uniref:hypothetical protein n=1 Tax=Yoonia sediminilitoris TaxID=1286148 RepID=UPI0010574F6F|nr:hypothetical protein [Yoonia sediminilitoris]